MLPPLVGAQQSSRDQAARSGIAPHDFRRVDASLLVASGVDIATTAAILGHRQASVLLDVYARALRGPKRAAAVRLQALALLYPPPPAPQPEPDERPTAG